MQFLPSIQLTLSLEQLVIALEYLGGARLPSLPLDELSPLAARDWRLLRAAARRSLQAGELLQYTDDGSARLAEPLRTLLVDCLQAPICDSVLVQDPQASSLNAYYRVADGCIAHTTVSSGLHRLSRHPTQTGRDFARQAVGSIAEPPNATAVSLPREIFGSTEQPTAPAQLAAALAPFLDAAAVKALSAPSRIVTLQHAVARRAEPPTLRSVALYWADDSCWALQAGADRSALLVTPLSTPAIESLLAAHFS
jgi:hypothetical protein